MDKRQTPDYKILDLPEITQCLFHPRKEELHRRPTEKDLMKKKNRACQRQALF